VRFTLKARNTRFGVDHLSVKLWGSRVNIVPKHIWAGKDPLTFRNYQAGTSPVFSGPYKLKSFDSNGKQFLYERDDNWWGARTGFKPLPKPKYLKFVVAGNESQTVSMMAQNNLDSAMTISLSAFETLKAQNSLVIPWRTTTPYGLPDACSRNLEFNTAVAPWNDAVLRRAVNYAINRSQVVHEAYADATFASVLPFPMYPALQRYTQLLVDNGAFTRHPISQSNPAAAVSLIESRGYTRGADGYFIKAGKQLTMNIISVDWAPEMAAWSQVVARQLRTVGISATVSTLTGREFYDNLYYGRFQALAGWNTCSTLHEPWDTLNTLHGKYVVPVGTFTTRNPWRWNNTAFSNAVDQMEQSTPGTATYDNAYATAMEQFLTDLPVIPMVQFMKIAPFSTKYWTNWPTSQNAYALPVTWWQSTFQILVNLQPVP